MLFNVGRVVATPGAIDRAEKTGVSLISLLVRHQSGDWGELTKDDQQANAMAVYSGNRILSSYRVNPTGDKIWCITEADRSSTCFLLPSEY